jgi:imidazolonepropionase-like amidohydrolase
VDSIDHGAYLDKDALQAMEENGTVWVPTLSTIGNLRGKGRFNEDAVRKILDSALANVAQYKGLLAAGTDAGAWAVPHGSTTEEGYFAMAGVGEDRLMEGFRVIEKKF